MPPLPRIFVHDANQCLHVIRLAAESLLLDLDNPSASPERRIKRLSAILSQVDAMSALLESTQAAAVDAAEDDAEDEPAGPNAVLVVDDEALAAMMLGEYLEYHGHTVIIAHDGQEALDLCRTQVFDAVVTDIRMPRMGGDELIGKLADLQPGTPVLVVSGHVREDEFARFPDNVRRIFSKPFAPSQVCDELAAIRAAAPPIGD